ncbi:hypothetical protein DPMN_177996 [Dreissena polymorpha]|uniref:Uncharacterized protein n=1 Tax=Dreissena polymorpha TaxID=45954 RepID=A0A9D4EEB3_DREPO|nr:hypothetical protein DPMN_177996 [Dreissena polymorpha]
MTKFHEDWAKNVSSRLFTCCHNIHVHTEKTAPTPDSHVFQMIMTIFKLFRDAKNVTSRETNVQTKFHEDWQKMCTLDCSHRKLSHPPGSHVFQMIITTIFELAKNVTSRENDPPHWWPCFFFQIRTIFELNHCIQKTNIMTKFHEDWAKYVSSRLFTIEKCPTPWRPCFPPIMTILKLAKNVTSRVFTSWRPCFFTDPNHFRTQPSHPGNKYSNQFHEHCTTNVTSRVFTCFHYIHIEKTAPPPGSNVFSPIWTIFELIRDINETNVLTKFNDDWTKIVTSRVFTRNTAPPPGGHVFKQTRTIFELNQHIIKTNILTKLHEDWASNVTSTTNLLTKFNADQTINVATRVFTRQTFDDGRRTMDKR